MKKKWIKMSLIAATTWLPLGVPLWAEETATGTGQPAPVATEQPPALTASVAVPVLSAYVWRGIIVTDKAVVQPNATLSAYGFSFNTWANYNFTDAYSEETRNEVSEVDFTLSYSHTFGPVTLGGSFAEYEYPNQTSTGADGISTAVPGTREVQVSAGLASIPLAPTVTLVRDIDEVNGFYASLALSQTFSLSEKIGLTLGFSTGAGDKDYNAAYFNTENTKLVDGNASVNLPIAITKSVTLTPQVQYTWLWDSEVRDQAGVLYKDESAVWGGATLSVAL